MKRWGAGLASVVLAVGLWTGQAAATPMMASRLLAVSEMIRDFYVFGVIELTEEVGLMVCSGEIRKGAILSQSVALMHEHPEKSAAGAVLAAMYQLGCRVPESTPTKVPA